MNAETARIMSVVTAFSPRRGGATAYGWTVWKNLCRACLG